MALSGRARAALMAALSLLAGLAAALAHPPFGILPGLLGYGALMILADRAPRRRGAFLRGWLAGTAYFTVGCWWVFEAFQVDAATYGWMAPFAVGLLAGGLGLFWGAAMALYRWAAPKGALKVVLFAALLSSFEWLRGHVLTGFPWNLPGETWLAGGMMSQSAALFGVYGLGWITLFAASAPALVVVNAAARSSWLTAGSAAAVLAALAAWGSARLAAEPAPAGPAVSVRLVQPNFSELARYDAGTYAMMLGRYLELTARPAADGAPPQMVFWPEGALPVTLERLLDPAGPERAAITGALQPGQILVLGAVRSADGGEFRRVFNSLAVIRRGLDDIELLGIYDKHRLVPFGEYTPGFLQAIGFDKMVPVPGTFDIGPPPQAMPAGSVIIQPLICYEALYPGFTRRGEQISGRRADMIVNLSNDGWFGHTSGPLQHLNLARYRAIEEGLMMVRSTPGGVSAVIDAHGRIPEGARLDLGESGNIDAVMNNVQLDTPYRRYGDLPFALMLLISGFAFGATRVAKRAAA